MQVEISRNDDYCQIRIPIKETYDNKTIRKFINYLKIKQNASTSQVTDEDIQVLSDELMGNWWNNNKDIYTEKP